MYNDASWQNNDKVKRKEGGGGGGTVIVSFSYSVIKMGKQLSKRLVDMVGFSMKKALNSKLQVIWNIYQNIIYIFQERISGRMSDRVFWQGFLMLWNR